MNAETLQANLARIRSCSEDLQGAVRETLPWPVFHFAIHAAMPPNSPYCANLFIDILKERHTDRGWWNSTTVSLIAVPSSDSELRAMLRDVLTDKTRELADEMQKELP